MPRFYLNLRRGPEAHHLTVDPEGDELEDASMLQAHVLKVARAMRRTRSHAVRDWMVCSFEVMDDGQRLVTIVPFSEMVTGDEQA